MAMTNIELQFFQSAINYFRDEHRNREMNHNDMRFWASTLILSGMSNQFKYLDDSQCREAVELADCLIKTLAETNQTKK